MFLGKEFVGVASQLSPSSRNHSLSGKGIRRRRRRLPRLANGLLVPTIVCAWFASHARCAQSNQQLPDELRAAATAENAGRYEQAAELYQRALSAADVTRMGAAVITEARTRLATDYFLLHRYKESLEAIEPVTSHGAGAGITPQAWLVDGLDRLELGEFAGAEAALRKTLDTNPGSGTARLALGDALARSGHMEAAAREYRNQTERTPDQPDARYKLGLAYAQLSTEVAKSYAQSHPEDPVAQQLTAEQSLNDGNALQAARDLFNLLRNHQMQPQANSDLGEALVDLGYPKTAEEHFGRELAQDPLCPRARLGLAETASLRGDWALVASELRDLDRDQPRELGVLLQLQPPGTIRDAWRRGKIAVPADFAATPTGGLWKAWLAGADTLPALAAPRATDSCPHLLANAQTTLGAWLSEDCYRNLRRHLIAKKSRSREETLKLAETYFRLGDYEQARAEAESARRADPASDWAAYWLSQSYGMLAQDCFAKVTAENPNSARVHEMLAHYWTGRRFFPKAEAEYQAAIRLAPDLPDLHLGLATVYLANSEWSDAKAELKRTLELAPGSALAEFELGDAYVQQQRYDLALPHLKHAVDDKVLGQKARLDLAEAEAATGATAEAVAELVALAPDDRDGQIHYRLARLYRKLGDKKKERDALSEFRKLQGASLQAGSGELLKLDEEQQASDEQSTLASPP
jgi:predicted Zn-dependent protease